MLHATILRRRPRTRRDRALAQVHAVRQDAESRWKRFRHARHHRAVQRRARDLFTELGQALDEFSEPAARTHHKRLHARRHR